MRARRNSDRIDLSREEADADLRGLHIKYGRQVLRTLALIDDAMLRDWPEDMLSQVSGELQAKINLVRRFRKGARRG